MHRLNISSLAALTAVLLIGLTVAAAPVAAQSGGNSTAPNASAQDTERIDDHTVLVDSGFNSAEGEAWVTIRSDKPQAITVVDGSYMVHGGEATVRTVVADPGEATTITIPAEKVEGRVALSISTDEALYGEIIEVNQSLFKGPATWGTTQVAGAGSALGTLLVMAAGAWWRKRGGSGEVNRHA